jgi:hypothetical protein
MTELIAALHDCATAPKQCEGRCKAAEMEPLQGMKGCKRGDKTVINDTCGQSTKI